MKLKPYKYTRYNTPGQPHGLSFICYQNRKFLNYKRTRIYFIEALNRARDKYKFDIWAYVIMQEHVHLLIYPGSEDYSISNILKSIKQPVARRTINFLKTHKPANLRFMETGLRRPRYRFWQDGGGYDRNIRNQNELLSLMEYIHENPVRRGLVDNPEQWYWSSAGEWLSEVRGPLRIDKESFPIL